MNTKKTILKVTLAVLILTVPFQAMALSMPGIFQLPETERHAKEAKAYLVLDRVTGQVMLSKNQELMWPPASLTKLVTALVFLDAKISLEKATVMKKEDEVGGARIATKAGVAYKNKDLLHAALIGSANNATNALARATGLSRQEFLARMNQKAKDLGALHTSFVDPSGISEASVTTAEDFAKIVNAAFSNKTLSSVAVKSAYSFRSTNNTRYSHTIKNTNKLLTDSSLEMIGGKTGYLEESMYNFATVSRDRLGNEYIIVVLGAPTPTEQFGRTKELAMQAMAIKVFNPSAFVLGTSTFSVLVNH